MRGSNRNFNPPPPPHPGKPRAFDYFMCPGSGEFGWLGLTEGGEFDLYLGGWGKLNRKCQVSGVFFFFREPKSITTVARKGHAIWRLVSVLRIYELETSRLESRNFAFRNSKLRVCKLEISSV